MSEVLLPTWIIPEDETHEWLDEGSSVFGSAFAPGIAQRQSFGGLRLKLSRRHTVRGEEKAQLLSILNATRGRYNVLRTKVHFALRGSGLGTELLTNNTFASGSTGWSNSSSSDLSISDRIARLSRVAVTSSTHNIVLLYRSTAITTVQYAPHVARAMFSGGRYVFDGLRVSLGTISQGSNVAEESIPDFGMATCVGVSQSATTFFRTADDMAAGLLPGMHVDIPYVSMSRSFQVDNGLNSLLQSDEFDTTWTATRASVDDQTAGTNAPDGTATADSIIEDATASNSHFVTQSVTVSSSALDYALSVAVKAGARTWAQIVITENTGGTSAVTFINLSTGALGTDSAGANWSNVRSFAQSLGDGWYKVSLVARKTNAATSISARVGLATGDNGQSYTGDGTSNIYAWRATLAQSGVPTRLIQTTTTESTGTSQTGNALHVKGLPASTNGLLLPGDYFEINGEIKQATAALNSDAAGLGYLQFEPALVRSPANDDPVIVTDPMGKFLVSNIKVQNQFGTQAVVTYDLEHVYE